MGKLFIIVLPLLATAPLRQYLLFPQLPPRTRFLSLFGLRMKMPPRKRNMGPRPELTLIFLLLIRPALFSMLLRLADLLKTQLIITESRQKTRLAISLPQPSKLLPP